MADRTTLPKTKLDFADANSQPGVNEASQGLNAFGLNLKFVLDDLYSKIAPIPGPSPANIKTLLDMEYVPYPID